MSLFRAHSQLFPATCGLQTPGWKHTSEHHEEGGTPEGRMPLVSYGEVVILGQERLF